MQDLSDSLNPLLANELALYASLFELLHQENEALRQRDIDSLETVTCKKITLIQHLKDSIRQRQAYWPDTDHQDTANISMALANANNQETAALWQQLCGLATDCQDSNRLNGLLIQQLKLQTQQAINILCDHRPDHTALYDLQGLNTSLPNSRNIIS